MVTLLAVIYTAPQLVAAPLLARLGDRHGRRPVLLAGVLGSAVGYAMFGVGGALWVTFPDLLHARRTELKPKIGLSGQRPRRRIGRRAPGYGSAAPIWRSSPGVSQTPQRSTTVAPGHSRSARSTPIGVRTPNARAS